MGHPFTVANGANVDGFEAFVNNHRLIKILEQSFATAGNGSASSSQLVYDHSARDVLRTMFHYSGELTPADVSAFVQNQLVYNNAGPLALFQTGAAYTAAGLYLGRFVDGERSKKDDKYVFSKRKGLHVFLVGDFDDSPLESFAVDEFPREASLLRPIMNIDKPAPTSYTVFHPRASVVGVHF